MGSDWSLLDLKTFVVGPVIPRGFQSHGDIWPAYFEPCRHDVLPANVSHLGCMAAACQASQSTPIPSFRRGAAPPRNHRALCTSVVQHGSQSQGVGRQADKTQQVGIDVAIGGDLPQVTPHLCPPAAAGRLAFHRRLSGRSSKPIRGADCCQTQVRERPQGARPCLRGPKTPCAPPSELGAQESADQIWQRANVGEHDRGRHALGRLTVCPPG